MAIIVDERAHAAIARRRARGEDGAVALWIAAVPHPGLASALEVLAMSWAARCRPRQIEELELRHVGDTALYIATRLARYTCTHDLTVSAWRLGPLSHLVVEHDGYVLRELQDWERTHPAVTRVTWGQEGLRMLRPHARGGRLARETRERRGSWPLHPFWWSRTTRRWPMPSPVTCPRAAT